MAAYSYLLVSPAKPNETNKYTIRQRQTISFACALALSSPKSELIANPTECYFSSTVADALQIIGRAINAWSYNTYFRDVFGGINAFRNLLSDLPEDSNIYLNITELIANSPSPKEDVAQLRLLPNKMDRALKEIEGKSFTTFLKELRKVSYPLVNVPVTGDRDKDHEILKSEIRGGTSTTEEELTLQIIGMDRDGSLLKKAVDLTKLGKPDNLTKTTSNIEHSHSDVLGEPQFTLTSTNVKKTIQMLKDAGAGEIHITSDRTRLILNGVVFEVK